MSLKLTPEIKQTVKSKFNEVFQKRVAPAHRQATLDHYAPQINKLLNSALKTLPLSAAPTRGLILTGSVGTGKTSALGIIARAFITEAIDALFERIEEGEFEDEYALEPIAKHGNFYFCTHAELVKSLREDAGDAKAWWDMPMVIIDDYGVAYHDNAGWNLYLEQVFFDHRFKNRLPLWMSTNYTPSKLANIRDGKKVFNIDEEKAIALQRIIDRICDADLNQIINITGTSGRRQKGE